MDIVIGGAYHGKLSYVLEHYGLSEQDYWECTTASTAPDLSKKIIYDCHKLVYALAAADENPVAWFETQAGALDGKILIFDDNTAGIVPVDALARLAREENGRVLVALCKKANRVVRVFCGIPTILKG